MRCLRPLSFCLLGLLATQSRADALKYSIRLLGSTIGESTYERRVDSTFVSQARLTLMGKVVDSSIEGRLNGQKVVSFQFAQTGTPNLKGSYEAKKFHVEAGEKVVDQEAELKSGALFGNWHPGLLRTVIEAAKAAGSGAQKIDTLVLDGMVMFPVTVEQMPAKTAVIKGQNVSFDVYHLKIGAVEADCLMASDGDVAGLLVPSQKFEEVREGFDGLFIDPTERYPELSQPTISKIRSESKLMIPMRDKVALAADITRPDQPGKYPVVLVRTPYGRAASALQGGWYASRGYVLVCQDVRGRGDSQGDWDPFVNERNDGYDTIEWIAKQPWCDGNVGMIGGSYVGWVQWAAAVERPKALKCIVPQVSPPDAFTNIPYENGVPMLMGSLWWASVVKDRSTNPTALVVHIDDPSKLTTLPLNQVDDKALGEDIAFFDKWLERDTMAKWKGFDTLKDLPKVKIPALHISGWWDGDNIGTRLNWAAMRKAGAKNQWLIYGPWTHAFNSGATFAGHDYGPDAVLELDSVYLRWFDTWLKHKKVGLEKLPKAKIFVTGIDEWRDLDDWPSSTSVKTTYFLSAPGSATGLSSTGKLSSKPSKTESPSTYVYDPSKVSTPDKSTLTMEDSSTLVNLTDKNEDLLLFRTSAFDKPLTLTGPISVELYFSSSAMDADFFATLVDIDETGAMNIIGLPGKIRASYVQGFDKRRFLTPGKIMRATIPLWDTAHQFAPGHRMGLLINSNSFPGYARNLGTDEPIATGTKMVVATQSVYHDAINPSSITFSVLPEK